MSRKRHKVDPERTAGAFFSDSRSYITIFGKEYLFGYDKELLRRACFERDQHTCTKCHTKRDESELDMHHIKPLGKGGDDQLANVTTRCKWTYCHRGEHPQVHFHWQVQP